jgi:hypothetical protein
MARKIFMCLKLVRFLPGVPRRIPAISAPSVGPRRGNIVCRLSALLALWSFTGHAQQNSLTISNDVPAQTPYLEVSRGPHSRVMQSISTWTNAAGKSISKTNSYTELATGLSYKSEGQWIASSDQIQITANGAAATNGQHQVYFAANLNAAGAVDMVMPDGQHLTGIPMFLSYFDGTNSVLIGELQDSIGQLLPSLNQVLYTNAFTDIQAAVRYTVLATSS